MDIILYTTHCPQCHVIETKLNQKKIPYVECTDVKAMLKLGIASAPALSIDGTIYNFVESVKWVNQFEVEKCI